jgi:hypothetical protein
MSKHFDIEAEDRKKRELLIRFGMFSIVAKRSDLVQKFICQCDAKLFSQGSSDGEAKLLI